MLSIIYKEIVNLRYYYYIKNSHSFYSGITTISIGNLQMGGGGKTPFIINLLQEFSNRGLHFIHASRAYKSKAESKGMMIDLSKHLSTEFTSQDIGDEPLMIMENLKKGVYLLGKKRVDLIQKFSTIHSKTAQYEVMVLEDAFQHFRISRDLDVLLIDVTCPLGKFSIFPLGPLRESATNLWRADFIILTKVNQITEVELKAWREYINSHKRKDAKVSELEYLSKLIFSLDGLSQMTIKECGKKPIVLCSAIANPKSFERLVLDLNFTILKSYHLPDHSSFSKNKIETILDYASQNDAYVLCTEKDAVKLRLCTNSDRIYYVKLLLKPVDAEVEPWNWLINFVQK